ncbi:glutamine--fructose-6-phosphate transaminase (isomerizing) [Aureliella helgolandensis]|uniref:Glutamine--fructose-6-phosphate aminotransferase [isomerizing] n=1 Tax=Aureliella helgolandensis TaxID=2527968 RepID=A0A518G4M3_9BACT|nr:glutamine--fructose-6-phosphate transaminase (isomerizing) [Aureliella helgolandensis]QDV23545.1 Glutamine--fructose-6-phosphate aminotransferase [isomerizing] [Aureliella helgolandensis]
MCGIVGYIGANDACPFLLAGLQRLEYRGYDSAGIATLRPSDQIRVTRVAGRVADLDAAVKKKSMAGNLGIGHTRWATHGAATAENAHPHSGGNGVLSLAHNGVIENYESLKSVLQSKGYVFHSQTDSEVVAHLIAECLKLSMVKHAGEVSINCYVEAVQDAISQLRGTYGLVIVFRDQADLLIAARCGSPLVVGVGKGEQYVASDTSPLIGFTDRIIYLADHQIAVIRPDNIQVLHRDQGRIRPDIKELTADAVDVTLEGYAHYMLKEIYEQPHSITNALRGRLDKDNATAKFGGLNLTTQQLRSVERIVLTGCGTSWHSALVGEYLFEELARIPVEVEYASELRYRNPPTDRDTVIFGITQSGETADTLAALREMKRKGHHTLAICNVIGSSIAQEADGGIYLHAGPEIGVASTKAFTSQLTVLSMLALYFGRLRHLSYEAGQRIIAQLEMLPEVIQKTLECHEHVKHIAARYADATNFLYLGRKYNFPTALEGALKLKEISYIHAEGYPAAEMKHGPIALVDEHTPSVFIVPNGTVYDKVLSNLQEVKARGGPVIAIVDHEDPQVANLADEVIMIPQIEDFLQPIVASIPLQLLSYEIALLRGCDVDMPRNLAKSVTVE